MVEYWLKLTNDLTSNNLSFLLVTFIRTTGPLDSLYEINYLYNQLYILQLYILIIFFFIVIITSNLKPIHSHLFFTFIWAEILHNLQQSCFTAKYTNSRLILT